MALAENNISNLQKVVTALNNLSYENRGQLSFIVNQFSSLYQQTHSDGDVWQAEYERDTTLPEKLAPTDSTVTSKLAECKARTGSNNGGNSS